MSTPLYFFGCWDDGGHHLYGPDGNRIPKPARLGIPFRPPDLDSNFAPKDPRQTESRATVTHLRGWTIVAWWDRAGDSRPDSNSAFLMKGEHTLTAVLLEAGEQYPELLPRFATLA